MKYAPKELVVDGIDHGFDVEREYTAADKTEDVVCQPGKNGLSKGYIIKAGSRVKVTVTLRAQSTRTHVALVDYLPAGMEILNPAIRGDDVSTGLLSSSSSSSSTSRYGEGYKWWRYSSTQWFDHQNLRDERAEAFCSYLSSGVYTYSYYTRATTLGTFVAPPAKAEEMYSPEVFGASASSRVQVV